MKELIGLVNLDEDGCITYDEFISFYSDLSVNIPSDDTFCRFVAAQWGQQYKASPPTKAEEVKTALRTIRFKLLQKAGNTHE